ncbi:Chaperone protein TorD [bioreactor metagenome]|uniref:Chaperone protein TorD n=1 Tax=bioreactor metagenome TaxID=1076179 RepID=A0A645JG03_9ZZZZ
MQESTLALVALYEAGGFEIDEDFRDLPDHIAAELEFLYLLNFGALAAELEDDKEAAADRATLRQQFLSGHLIPWIAPFAAAVKAGAESDFYRELADLTARFVAMQADMEGPG